jgi:hypothetical protein
MSQGTPDNALANILPNLFSKDESDIRWVNIVAELGRRLSSCIMPHITLKQLRQQMWRRDDEYRYELGDKMKLDGFFQDVYSEQGLFVAQEMVKTDAGVYIVHFIGILRDGCWVRGTITFDPVIYQGRDLTFDSQEGGILFVERTNVAQILSYWEWKPRYIIQKLVNESSRLIRDKEARMERLKDDFRAAEYLEQILSIKYGSF